MNQHDCVGIGRKRNNRATALIPIHVGGGEKTVVAALSAAGCHESREARLCVVSLWMERKVCIVSHHNEWTALARFEGYARIML